MAFAPGQSHELLESMAHNLRLQGVSQPGPPIDAERGVSEELLELRVG